MPAVKNSGHGSMMRRSSSTAHYQTFGGITPPKNRGRPLSDSSNDSTGDTSQNDQDGGSSPLPKKQMAILAIIALSEQTALNSISPYLPDMAASFPDVSRGEVGVYVGTIASAFALAQLATNFFWGWLSDRIGRKPVILTGTILTAACLVAFGFCRTLWQAIVVQALMGVVNGNQAVVSSCLGEITDRSNQSKAFTYLPVIYGIGGITGPIIGGLLVSHRNIFDPSKPNPYPYLPPNLASAAILVADFIITIIFFEETLENAQYLAPFSSRLRSLFTWFWQFSSMAKPGQYRHKTKRRGSPGHSDGHAGNPEDDDSGGDGDDDDTDNNNAAPLLPASTEDLKKSDVFNRDTILLLITYLIFQLSNISFNSLYPIFASSEPPAGRLLKPGEIGLSLGFAGAVTILFQVGVFGKLREKMGNRWAYRAGLAGFVIADLMMPWVGYKEPVKGVSSISSNKIALWMEIGLVLLIKTVAAVGGLTSALLLITNSAPNHAVLGTLNGLAQTLSAAGRAVGPFLAGGLFSIAIDVRPKGEALAFGVFGGITFVGFLLSFGIRSTDLEAAGWDSDEDGEGSSVKSDDEP